MEFSCTEEACNYDGVGPYVLSIPQEACVDEHNIATPFCPHCGRALIKTDSCEEHLDC